MPSKLEELEAIYRRIPRVACRGMCQDSCGPLGMTRLERSRIVKAAGCGTGADPATHTCNMLTPDGRCGVYAVRPAVCRLWGATEYLPCPHGCRPERVLSRAEAVRILRDVAAVGGAGWVDPVGLSLAGVERTGKREVAR
jgi:hypothetical protein